MARPSQTLLLLPAALALLLLLTGHSHALSHYTNPLSTASQLNRPEGALYDEFVALSLQASSSNLSGFCAASPETNFTRCSSALRPDGSEASLASEAEAFFRALYIAEASDEASREASVDPASAAVAEGDDGDSESMEDKWNHFVREMEIYARRAIEYLQTVAEQAVDWSDLAHEWAFNTAKRYPYNTMLSTSNGKVDRYTDDVSVYAAALASFAAGFGDATERAIAVAKEFETFARSTDTSSSGWHSGARDLTLYSAHVSEKVSYLSTYAEDLSTSVRVWFQNVEFLYDEDVNATMHSFPVLEKADFLYRFAGDIADSTAEWAASAQESLRWAEDWTSYGELYG